MDQSQTKDLYLKIIQQFITELNNDREFTRKLKDSGIEFIKNVFVKQTWKKKLDEKISQGNYFNQKFLNYSTALKYTKQKQLAG